MTANATTSVGDPVPGLPVHLTVAGANPQTVDLVTAAAVTATLTYDGPNLGQDTVSAIAIINGPAVQARPLPLTWVSSVGTPCTGRAPPLDAVIVIDGSPSMFADDQIEMAQAATDALINDLDFTRDQVAGILFSGDADVYSPLTSDGVQAAAQINQGIYDYVHACDGFCVGGTNFPAALEAAVAELQSRRHRSGATPLMIFLSDGGNTGADPTADIAAVKAAGIRSIALGYGSAVNVPLMLKIASSTNDYFYSAGIRELTWAIGNVLGDTCRTQPPLVSAGPSQSGYEVHLPAALTLQGEAHGAGPQGDVTLTSTWTQISGPAPVVFADPTSPTTSVLFSQPGTYVLQLETSDGFLTTASTTTVTVDPDPSIIGASLTIALASAGPLATGTSESVTAALVDSNGRPIAGFLVQLAVAGANPGSSTALTDHNGIASFSYVGTNAGDDVLQATALGSTLQVGSNTAMVSWQASQGGAVATQGWIGSPAHQATVTGVVPVTLGASVTLTSGTVSYWPIATPSQAHVITSAAQGGPGATIAELDTTRLANGVYVVDLTGIDDHGQQNDSEVALTVSGDYKPGRKVLEVTDFRVPIAGTPITVGRRYDSLDKDSVDDFGNGWSLSVGHPNVQTDPAHNVTVTMPSGRRVTFYFRPSSYPFPFRFLSQPAYQAEPGTFGTLTSDGCELLVPQDGRVVCFAEDTLEYAPTTYTYTDPRGTSYQMGTDGTLKAITDLNNNRLTFTADGISSPTGQTVTFTRDASGRITKILTPSLGDFFNTRFEYDYTYDDAGNLTTVQAPTVNVFPQITRYTYDDAHRLLTVVDPSGHARQTSTYGDDGRLASVQDGMGNLFQYAYDLTHHTTTTTFPDPGCPSLGERQSGSGR